MSNDFLSCILKVNLELKLFDYIYGLFIFCIPFVYFTFSPINVDSSWSLYLGKQILEGSTLYVDFLEVNPPLVFIYFTFVNLLANIFSLPITYAFIFFILVLILISTYYSYIVLKSIYKTQTYIIRTYLYFIILILSLFVTYDFGEREHIFIILIFPYILLMMYRNTIKLSSYHIISIAIIASLGFNIKPHFFLIFLGIEVVYLLHTKKISSLFRKDFLIITASAFVYLFIIFVFFKEYYTFMIPFAIDTYTDAFRIPSINLLFRTECIFAMFISIFFFIISKKRTNLDNKILLSVILTTLLMYILQEKGWAYQRLPLFIISLFFLLHYTMVYFRTNKNDKKKKDYIMISLYYIYMIVILSFLSIILNSNMNNVYYYKNLKKIIYQFPNHSSIMIMSTDIAQGQPLLKKSQTWASRFPSLFMLSALRQKQNYNNHNKIKTYTLNAIYEDLLKYKPDIIVFPSKKLGFDYYNYFTKEDERLKNIYEKNYIFKIQNNYIILIKNIIWIRQ